MDLKNMKRIILKALIEEKKAKGEGKMSKQCADCGKACEAYRCDECRKARQRERWAKRYNDPRFKDKERERSRTKMAKWRKNHAEQYQEYRRKYYSENRERILAYQKAYHARKKGEKQ